MSHSVTVRHNFETAHRLPQLPGKCVSLHGHSWWAEVTVSTPALDESMVVEFGPYKRLLREWIDTNLDHGTMLGPDDPLVPMLTSQGCKVYEVVGWPTVENVAALLAVIATELLSAVPQAPNSVVTRVHVTETAVNAADWIGA